MNDTNKIKLKFELTNQYGDHFEASSDVFMCEEFGDTELQLIGRYMNTFLAQVGYIRDHTEMFMESITEEEYDMLCEYLNNLRSKNGQGN